jgi:hypothetical protein
MQMDRMVALCGVICTDCPAYIATQADDRDALEQVLVHWREESNAPDITVEDIICDGCLTRDGRLNGYCQQCKVRSCAVVRDVTNCAYCAEYVCDELKRLLRICDRQEGFFGFARKARATLHDIRAELDSL